MNTETTPDGALSDDDLAKIAWEAYIAHDDDDPDLAIDPMLDVARAVRAALAREHDAEWDALNREIADLAAIVHGRPAVTPLRPGETVTIPDAHFPRDGLRVHALRGPDRDLILTAALSLGSGLDLPDIALALDAAGVRALQTACQRFLAAQEGDDG